MDIIYSGWGAELVGTLPLSFVPDEIDNRLLQGRVSLTLLGIWNIDPESDFIIKTDSVIRGIANLLTINPEITRLDANLVAEQIHISIKEVRVIFILITLFVPSYYWSGGNPQVMGTDSMKFG
jgi:phage shock protein PspC (stress-responsive transcriptional regulator)